MKNESCDYGCWYGILCMGVTRAEAIEFLCEKIKNMSNTQLTAELQNLIDEGYNGPTHVNVKEPDLKTGDAA